MKTLGLLGGTTWVSTVEYYKLINLGINNKLGDLNAAHCILYSLNMEDVMELKRRNDQNGIIELVLRSVDSLTKAGIDVLVLCANTLHFSVDRINESFDVPIIHIARATAGVIKEKGFSKVGLLGTRQTMEQDFYTGVLKDEGIETLIPEEEDRNIIDKIIFTELANDKFHDSTRDYFLGIMDSMHRQGAEGVILGCTEIPLLIKQEYSEIPIFNTLKIHVDAAVEFATS